MTEPRQTSTPLTAGTAVASAIAVAASGVSVTYTAAIPYRPPAAQPRAMSPQDHALVDAKTDAKLATLGGDVRLNTQGLADLKERFSDLAGKMASVPTDIAAMKRDIAHLPSKGFIVTATTGALVAIAALSAFVQWVLSAHIAG